jgi:hypothetical protein
MWLLTSPLFSCTYDEISVAPEKPDGCQQESGISYSTTVAPIISANCNMPSCHASGSGNPELGNYNVLAAEAQSGELEYRLLLPLSDPKHMPVGFLLDECDLYRIRVWIYEGYPNN